MRNENETMTMTATTTMRKTCVDFFYDLTQSSFPHKRRLWIRPAAFAFAFFCTFLESQNLFGCRYGKSSLFDSDHDDETTTFVHTYFTDSRITTYIVLGIYYG